MTTLVPVAVDLDRISAVIGSKDKRLLNLLTKKYQDEFDSIDERVNDLEEEGQEDEEDEKRVSLKALIRLLRGPGSRPVPPQKGP